MTQNVVEFPKSRIIREHAGVEYVEKAKEKSKLNFAESVSDDLVDALLEEIESMGIDTNSDQFVKDFSMTVDTLRATVYRTLDVPHHLHDFIDNNVKMIYKDSGKLVNPDEIDTDS